MRGGDVHRPGSRLADGPGAAVHGGRAGPVDQYRRGGRSVGSLVAIAIIVNNVGIPNSEAVIGFLLAVDRLLDMSRTAVNVFSDSCGAVVIARSEGEENLLAHPGATETAILDKD